MQASWTIDVEHILENAWVMIIECKGRKKEFFTGVQRARMHYDVNVFFEVRKTNASSE